MKIKQTLIDFIKELFSDLKYAVRLTFTTWLFVVIPFNFIGCYLYSIGFLSDAMSWLLPIMDMLFIVYLVLRVGHDNHPNNCFPEIYSEYG